MVYSQVADLMCSHFSDAAKLSDQAKDAMAAIRENTIKQSMEQSSEAGRVMLSRIVDNGLVQNLITVVAVQAAPTTVLDLTTSAPKAIPFGWLPSSPAPVLDLVGLVDDACTTAGPSPSSVSMVSEPVSQATSPVSACAPQDAVKTADAVSATVTAVAAVASVPAAAAAMDDEKKTSQTQDYKAVMLPLQCGELSEIPNHHFLNKANIAKSSGNYHNKQAATPVCV